MLSGAALRKTADGWKFTSEYALENFIWDNLQQLCGFTPLARQYVLKGEVCDILALNEARQLVILELKNTEDRYIIQQLTRYYDNLLDEKPFAEKIDYEQPIQLMAVAPSFHRHNLIDRKYNLLKIDLLQFNIMSVNQKFDLRINNINTNEIYSLPIQYQEINFTSTFTNIPDIPQLLFDWLGSCTSEEQQAIIQLREKILSFDERIQEEITSQNTILYSKSKNKPIAEICYHKIKSQIVVFLWLPTPTSRRKEVIGRIRLWLNGEIVTYVGHIPEGMGKMKLPSEWLAMPKEKRPGNYYHNKYSPFGGKIYKKFLQNSDTDIITLDLLADLALTKWLARI
jgi:RecB family endonuclease NucS